MPLPSHHECEGWLLQLRAAAAHMAAALGLDAADDRKHEDHEQDQDDERGDGHGPIVPCRPDSHASGDPR